MWPHQSSSWPGDSVGAWKIHLPQPGEGTRLKDHVTRRPRLHPGRKRGLGVSRASHTFHNKLTHGKNPATRPSNQGKQTRTNTTEKLTGPGKGRTHQLLPSNASRASACAHTAGKHGGGGGGIRSRAPARQHLLPAPTSTGERSHPSQPSLPGWGVPRSRGRHSELKAPRRLHCLVMRSRRGTPTTQTDMERNPIHAIKKGENRKRRRRP